MYSKQTDLIGKHVQIWIMQSAMDKKNKIKQLHVRNQRNTKWHLPLNGQSTIAQT